jgi:hypothetical protein
MDGVLDYWFSSGTALLSILCDNRRISLTLYKIARFQIENCSRAIRSFRMDTLTQIFFEEECKEWGSALIAKGTEDHV